MTAKLVKWASSDGSITKSWLSGRRNAVFLLPVVGFSYDGSRIEGHLGNVGLNKANHVVTSTVVSCVADSLTTWPFLLVSWPE